MCVESMLTLRLSLLMLKKIKSLTWVYYWGFHIDLIHKKNTASAAGVLGIEKSLVEIDILSVFR